ncbi:unnamed protein product [Lactuca virosa]|uniref:F-box associated beta-propeller type 3 domain-containing protein n=1 Tax=Lactuca virosa TaxID=75947 RepID=A0AAU9PSC4_9ASTR|nr:unnamed protein product [Lactuca virosa]
MAGRAPPLPLRPTRNVGGLLFIILVHCTLFLFCRSSSIPDCRLSSTGASANSPICASPDFSIHDKKSKNADDASCLKRGFSMLDAEFFNDNKSRNGHWIVLDEFNLAHYDILEPLNRRIVMSRLSYRNGPRVCDVDDRFFDDRDCHLLGSSNGLVCISSFSSQLVVANPSTREVQTLRDPQIHDTKHLCWGFGYDSSTDDYKVVLGFRKRVGWTCFQVLSLKSNVWKLIGDVKYSFLSRIGILCNGALHWIMKDSSSPNKKRVITSFRLSEEKFIKIPQPDDEQYESGVVSRPDMDLGIMEDCVVICCSTRLGSIFVPLSIWRVLYLPMLTGGQRERQKRVIARRVVRIYSCSYGYYILVLDCHVISFSISSFA